MEFSESFQLGDKVEPVFSPGDGKYLAFLHRSKLVLVDVEECDILYSVRLGFLSSLSKAHAFSPRPERIIWSQDATMVAVAGWSLIEVYGFSESSEFVARIRSGPRGFDPKFTEFTPTPAPPKSFPALLTVSPCASILSVWSLVTCDNVTIRNPCMFDLSTRYTPDAPTLLAVLERHEAKDFMATYTIDGDDIQRVSRFQTSTRQATGLSWNPSSTAVAVWDTVLDCRLQIYSPEGLLLKEIEPYHDALGIKSVIWAPHQAASMVAVATCDNAVRVYSGTSWALLAQFDHLPMLDGDVLPIYVEVKPDPKPSQPAENHDPNLAVTEQKNKHASFFSLKQGEYFLPVATVSASSRNSAGPAATLGISQMAWSPDARFLASVSAEHPRVVWIWSIAKRELIAVLCHLNPVRKVAWDSSRRDGINARLAMVTGSGDIYLWTPAGTSCVQVPAHQFRANMICWSQAEPSRLVVSDTTQFCILFA